MLAPRELQTAFRRALLEEDAVALAALFPEIVEGDLSARDRLGIYRNNVFASLTDALRETFPVVCRLVGERFFSYAAHEFIVSWPPSRPSLMEYGDTFPDFLADFPPCSELTYLPDVARFEWLMNSAAHAPDAGALSPDALASVASEDAAFIVFTLHPSCGYIESRFPIDRIWRANRQEDCGEIEIDLAAGGICLEVSRQGNDVVFRKLEPTVFAFRKAVASAMPLGQAIDRAFARHADFDATGAVAALFAEGAVTAARLERSE